LRIRPAAADPQKDRPVLLADRAIARGAARAAGDGNDNYSSLFARIGYFTIRRSRQLPPSSATDYL
jgi:hypothetical protein